MPAGTGFKVRGEHGPGWTSCSCGHRSPVLGSDAKRRAWFHEHRSRVALIHQPAKRVDTPPQDAVRLHP